MSSAEKHLPKRKMTYEEFMEYDDGTDQRYELINGELVPIGGGPDPITGQASPTQSHQIIAANAALALGIRLKGKKPCRAILGMSVALDESIGLDGPCPDVLVTCEPVEKYVKQPCIVVEVLSRSSAKYDMVDKLAMYERCPSIKNYLVVHQHQRRVLNFARDVKGRLVSREETEEIRFLEPEGLSVTLDEIYEDVVFD